MDRRDEECSAAKIGYFEKAEKALAELNERANAIDNRVHALRDRVIGAQPECNTISATEPKSYAGISGVVQGQIEDLGRVLGDISDTLRGLEGL